jgi:hypothetical protein
MKRKAERLKPVISISSQKAGRCASDAKASAPSWGHSLAIVGKQSRQTHPEDELPPAA